MINIGDHIRLKCGETPSKCIDKHDDGTISTRYKSGLVIRRDEKDFCMLEHTKQTNKPLIKENKMALYQVIGQEIYGELLVKNSQGKLVLELKGSNEVKAYLPSEVEEVRPNVIAVYDGTKREFIEVPKDMFEVGDIFFTANMQIYRVVELGIKRAATSRITECNKLETKYLKFDEDTFNVPNLTVKK